MNRKIRLCYLVSSLCNEGPVNVIYNILQYIDFNKFEVSVVTFIPEKESSRMDEFEKLPIKIYQLSSIKKNGLFTIYGLLKRKLKEINPDEIHAHCPRSLYLMPFLSKQYKKIYTIHIYPGEQQIQLYGLIMGKIVISLNHLFTRMCDLPIGCAESVGEQYKSLKGWEIDCIPNGASLPVWHYDSKEKEELRQELGLKEKVKYFIFIGRFSKEKNPDVLFEAFNNINRNDIGFVMLGIGPMWKSMKQKCPENIIMPGFTTRVYDYLKAVDYYISASEVEGLANTILESMSVGLPMLLSDIPSHQEVMANFNECSKVGYIINNRNTEDIRAKIGEILKLDSENTRRLLNDLYQRKYSAKVMSESYQKAYIDLIEDKR
jgi:glycosyltransferase involved in cell wall biosynthesis